MTLDEFISEQRNRLERFRAFYEAEIANAGYEREMTAGQWDEQLQIFDQLFDQS